MNFILKTLRTIGEIALNFAIWVVLFVFSFHLTIWFSTDNYQPNDKVDERFQVLLIDEKSTEHAEYWRTAKNKANAWVRQGNESCRSEDCLFAMKDGSLTFHNEGALWYSESRYLIKNNTITPISFAFVTFWNSFIAFVLAFVLLALGKYGVRRWRDK